MRTVAVGRFSRERKKAKAGEKQILHATMFFTGRRNIIYENYAGAANDKRKVSPVLKIRGDFLEKSKTL